MNRRNSSSSNSSSFYDSDGSSGSSLPSSRRSRTPIADRTGMNTLRRNQSINNSSRRMPVYSRPSGRTSILKKVPLQKGRTYRNSESSGDEYSAFSSALTPSRRGSQYSSGGRHGCQHVHLPDCGHRGRSRSASIRGVSPELARGRSSSRRSLPTRQSSRTSLTSLPVQRHRTRTASQQLRSYPVAAPYPSSGDENGNKKKEYYYRPKTHQVAHYARSLLDVAALPDVDTSSTIKVKKGEGLNQDYFYRRFGLIGTPYWRPPISPKKTSRLPRPGIGAQYQRYYTWQELNFPTLEYDLSTFYRLNNHEWKRTFTCRDLRPFSAK